MFFTKQAQKLSTFSCFVAGTALGIFLMLVLGSTNNSAVAVLAIIAVIGFAGSAAIVFFLNRGNWKLARQEVSLIQVMHTLYGWLDSRVDLRKGLDQATIERMRSFLRNSFDPLDRMLTKKFEDWADTKLVLPEKYLCLSESETRDARNTLRYLLDGQEVLLEAIE